MYKKMLSYTKGNFKWYFVLFICLGIKSAESLISPLIVSKIIDQSIGKGDIIEIIQGSIFAIFLYLSASLAAVISQGTTTKIERRITVNIRQKCIESCFKKNGAFYTNLKSSDIMTILMQDIENISSMLSGEIISVLYDIVMISGISFFLIYTYWKLAIVVFLALFVLLFIQKKLNKKIEKATEESRESAVQLQRPIQEMVTNMLSFIMGNMETFQENKIQIREQNFTKTKIKTAVTISEFSATISLISGVLVVIIIGLGSIQVINGEMSIGVLLAFEIYTQRFLSPLSDLSNINANLSALNVSLRRIEKFLNEDNYINFGVEIPGESGDIIFDNVTFGYKEDRDVLNNISLLIKKGRVHAFAGESGSGKSTIINLLYGLWQNYSGNILINGKNIKNVSIENLRKRISIVSQNIFLVDDSILNNILLDDDSPDLLRAENALKQAKIWKYINSLEQGWNTNIGENGICLSGGEKQRLAIARAIYRESDIIIFDEATSMLDNETENSIVKNIINVFDKSTIIMIAHRLTTIKNADKIFVLNKGEIIEEGTHEELLIKKGFYYNLYCYQTK